MKTLTVKFDLQLNDDEDFLKEGMKLRFAEEARVHEGFVAVEITNAFSHEGDPIEFVPFVDYFTPASFVELS